MYQELQISVAIVAELLLKQSLFMFVFIDLLISINFRKLDKGYRMVLEKSWFSANFRRVSNLSVANSGLGISNSQKIKLVSEF